MKQQTGLVHKKSRRGKKRRYKLRLVLRVSVYALLIGLAAGLSAGIIHVVERPVPPIKALADPSQPVQLADPLIDPSSLMPAVPVAEGPELATSAPLPASPEDETLR